MGKLAELRGRINVVSTEMAALAKKDERSADEESKLDQLLAEFNDLGPKIEREASIEAATASASKMTESRGRVSGIVPQDGAEEREREARDQDRRSFAQRFAENEELEHWRKSGAKGAIPTAQTQVGSFYHRDDASLVYHEDMTPQELRALIHTGNLPTDFIRPQFVPGIFRGDDLQGTVRSVLINGQTQSDAITFFRELTFTNAAAPVGQATATTGTSGLKPESAITFEQDTEPVKTIAHWIPITRQTIWDAAQLQTYTEQRLLDGLRLVESDQLLNGDGTGENLTGLRNTTGVQYLDNTATTGYWATNPVNGAGSDNENYNRILRAKRLVRTVGRARPSFVVLNPEDVEGYQNRTDANGQYFGSGPYGGAGGFTLWGLPVVEDENQAAGEALVGDGRAAAVWDRMQAQILIGTIDDQLIRNMLTILAEERVALTVFRPSAFVRAELAAFA